MSEARDVVQRFGAMMTADLPEGEAPSTPEERYEQLLNMIHPEFHLPVAGSLPYGGTHHGREGFIEMGQKFAETWNILDNPRPEFIDAGQDRVIALYTPTFQSRKTGRTVSFKMVEILTVRDGKIAELVPYYFDTMELVETFREDVAAAGTA